MSLIRIMGGLGWTGWTELVGISYIVQVLILTRFSNSYFPKTLVACQCIFIVSTTGCCGVKGGVFKVVV